MRHSVINLQRRDTGIPAGHIILLTLGAILVITLDGIAGQMPNLCFDCINLLDGKHYDFCPKDGPVEYDRIQPTACNGTCFSRTTRENSSVMVRGCSNTVGNLPLPLPDDGCYNWEGATICICSKPLCNIGPLGKSSGVALDAHMIKTDSGKHLGDKPGVLYCHQCSNYDAKGTFYSQCPRNGNVNPQMVYTGNCTGACFTRTKDGDSKTVYRGCSSTQYGLPYPLPPDGCYNYNDAVWCICNTSRCNSGPMGVSSGVEMDQHLVDSDEPIVETDGIMRCYQCLNYDLQTGVYYPQCPKESRVKNAYLGPCNGTCFTRSYDYNSSLVARGCTDTQSGLPDPLPPDGCYTWYSEVWCVCSTSRCNGKALGKAQNIEFDAHIPKKPGNMADSLQVASVLSVALLFLHKVVVDVNRGI